MNVNGERPHRVGGFESQGSLVSVMTRLWAGQLSLIPSRCMDFFSLSLCLDRLWGPLSLLSSGCWEVASLG